MQLSVVIPTRDRRPVLEATLDALQRQEGLATGAFEVVVVDDGSTDNTQSLLAAQTPIRCRWLRQPPRGPAAARNLGIRAARGDRVLLLGDDTVPAPQALAAHLAAARARDVGVQGHIDWDPTLEVTPVMHFLAPAGPQFYFRGLEDGHPTRFTAILGSNFSAPRAWFLDEPFDERFRHACLEDTELAYRWSRRGRPFVYAARAICWHRHEYPSLAPFLLRQHRAGSSARLVVRLHPVLLWTIVLQPLMVGALLLLRYPRRSTTEPRMAARRWDLHCRWAFARGFLGLPPPRPATDLQEG